MKNNIRHLTRLLLVSPELLIQGDGIYSLIKKSWKIIRKEGISGIKRYYSYADFTLGYQRYIRTHDVVSAATRRRLKENILSFFHKPKISIIMPVYNPPLSYLEQAIWSVRNQVYSNWELCIADDASTDRAVKPLLLHRASEDDRIKVVFREENGHISEASNSALQLASGEFIALLDQDDHLAETALYHVAKAILKSPNAGIIYSDEDKLEGVRGYRKEPYFKCDWNPDLFRSQNFISHLGVYRRSLVQELKGFRVGFEGSQDYDLALRCSEQLKPEQIIHIPKVLYHWRAHQGSTTSSSSEKPYALIAGVKAIQEHLARMGVTATVETTEFDTYRVKYAVPNPNPLVSIIIPSRNGYALLKQCIDSILTKTAYSNFEILIIDNGSDEAQTLAYFEELNQNPFIRVLRDERPFNYSALNNAAVKLANGSLIGLLNNDLEVISSDWLTEMVSIAARPEVGAVGARLWYPNDTLQHGGVILGLGGVAGHAHKHLPIAERGYFNRAIVIQNFSAVTAACLVIKKEIYELVGGLDEENLAVAFNDVDFCLKVREAGYWNVWTPYAELYHHESATRGRENTPKKKRRFKQEVAYMKNRWNTPKFNDPAYSPNLTLSNEQFSITWKPRVSSSN